ncbi:serine hydrolase [Chloroflexi bacterium TSY]|nr:serine hydrolase [Chloroflexi bacterium TSY]
MQSKILAQTEVASNIELLSAWIEAQMAYVELPGLSIGIGYDQELIWSRGFGLANTAQNAAATPKTIYRIASITKLFTATAILQLRDGGHLQLDDHVIKHLPWFSIQNRHADAPPITIRHLLTHTSGLPREATFPYWTDADFPSPTQIQERLPQQATILPTETKWKYSNLALSLAGEIVATVSGQAYVDYVQTQILDPLGMNDTYVKPVDAVHPQLAMGYGRRLPRGERSVRPHVDCRGITPAANMASTVEDLARFAMLQLRDGPAGETQILRGSTLREMQRIHWLQPDWQAGWGLGFYVWRQGDKTYVGHGGSLQGYRTEFQICPADKMFVIVLTNADDGNPLMYVEKAFQWVAPAIVKMVKAKPEVVGSVSDWQFYLGKYRDPWGDTQILVLNGELVMIDPSQPDPMLSICKLIPVREHTFRIETTAGFWADGELVTFEMSSNGKVQRVKIAENFSYPVLEW